MGKPNPAKNGIAEHLFLDLLQKNTDLRIGQYLTQGLIILITMVFWERNDSGFVRAREKFELKIFLSFNF